MWVPAVRVCKFAQATLLLGPHVLTGLFYFCEMYLVHSAIWESQLMCRDSYRTPIVFCKCTMQGSSQSDSVQRHDLLDLACVMQVLDRIRSPGLMYCATHRLTFVSGGDFSIYKRAPLYTMLFVLFMTPLISCATHVAPARYCASDCVVFANEGCTTEIVLMIFIFMKPWCRPSQHIKSPSVLDGSSC